MNSISVTLCHSQTAPRVFTLCLLLLASCVAGASREVSLTVHVQDEQGHPISECPLEAGTGYENKMLFTGPDGTATTTMMVDEGQEDTINLRLWHGYYHKNLSLEDVRRAEAGYEHVRTTWAFPLVNPPAIAAAQESASLTVTAEDAVTVRGKIVGSNGAQRAGTLMLLTHVAFGSSDPELDEQFTVPGVPKAQACDLWFGAADSQQVHRIHLSTLQTATDLNLGPITLADTACDSTIDVTTMDAYNLVDNCGRNLGRAISLVSTDGSKVFTFSLNPEGRAAGFTTEDTPLGGPALIPAGIYFIAPGGFGNHPFRRLLACIDAGKVAELQAAGVPKITVSPQQTATLQFDSPAAYAAVKEVAATLPPE